MKGNYCYCTKCGRWTCKVQVLANGKLGRLYVCNNFMCKNKTPLIRDKDDEDDEEDRGGRRGGG
jgi:hypothetical protein